jgi:hypothetical protein
MITQTRLKEVLDYDSVNDVFIWKEHPDKPKQWNGRYGGKKAGSLKYSLNTCYWEIYVDSRLYYQHQLVWLWYNGYIPKEIDHIDHDGLNNKLSNLREATRKENHRNMSIKSNNKTGVTGVYWRKDTEKYVAQIRNNEGKTIHLGTFTDLFEARDARKLAEKEYGYHSNHGKN